MNFSTAPTIAVMPARDEQTTIATVIAGVRIHLGCAVLVVNDASRDATAEVARGAGAQVLNLAVNLGAWGATQAGIRYALRHGYTRVLTLDADGQHQPEELPTLLQAHQQSHANVSIGTYAQRLSKAKRVAWQYFRLLTGLNVHDFTSGLRVYDARAIAILASREASLLDYQDIGVLMLLQKRGLMIDEVPTVMSPRQCGGSRVFASWRLVARYMLRTTLLCIARIGDRAPLSHGSKSTP